MSRKFFVGGNWKLNGSKDFVSNLVDELNSAELPSNTEVLIAPPTIYLAATRSAASEKLLVCAQNIYKASSGAYTGETGPAMLLDVGVNWTLLGHSERRNIFDESVELIGEKTKAAIDTGLSVVFCCGEQLPERESGKTNEVVFGQLAPLKSLGADAWEKIVIAYEPVWAIGTGKVATPEQAQDTHKAIRDWLSKEVSSAVAESTRILYGGSVKPDNCDDLGTQPDIDGFLVGGASLQADSFVKICNAKQG